MVIREDEFGRKTGLAKLIPQLQVFATPGRKVYFAFDRDTKASTIANVNSAIAKTGKLFAKYEDKNPACLVRDLVNHIEAGGRPFISRSAQKLKSKWGTQNLESYLELKFPNKKILRIDQKQ